jgi:hypothetical protein
MTQPIQRAKMPPPIRSARPRNRTFTWETRSVTRRKISENTANSAQRVRKSHT